jgi:tRNA(Arg) A34 adenosine deaminase TadA
MLSLSDQQRIRRAITAAYASQHHKIRVGAVVAVAGRLSISANLPRNDARICWQHASTHAEMAALGDAYRGGKGGTVYVARVGWKTGLLPSHPCERCVPMLTDAGIKRIVWFDGDEWTQTRLHETMLLAI